MNTYLEYYSKNEKYIPSYAKLYKGEPINNNSHAADCQTMDHSTDAEASVDIKLTNYSFNLNNTIEDSELDDQALSWDINDFSLNEDDMLNFLDNIQFE